jgi:hypothetical protein
VEFNCFCCKVLVELDELFTASDANLFSAFAHPDWERSAPVSVPGNSPVKSILDPVAETAIFH